MTDLLALLMAYHAQLSGQAEGAALVFLRVGAAVATLPALGEPMLPARIRLVAALMLTAALTPAVLPRQGGLSLAAGFAPEVMIGLLLGLLVRLFVLALQTAGSIAANATSLSQVFPAGAEAQPALSRLLVAAGLAVALQSGLLLRCVDYLLLSYDLLPVGHWPDSAQIGTWGVAQVGRSFALAFMIAMPFVIAALLYNVALGVINRALPQLMVTFIGAPALSLGGLVGMALLVPAMLTVWGAALHGFLARPDALP